MNLTFKPILLPLLQSVNVTVAPESVEDDLNSVKESILTSAPVWDESNSTVVKFSPALVPTQGDEEALLENYPIPQPNKFTLTSVRFFNFNYFIILIRNRCLHLKYSFLLW